MASSTIDQKIWNYCNIIRDDGMSYGDWGKQLRNSRFRRMSNARLGMSIMEILDTAVKSKIICVHRLRQAVLRNAFSSTLHSSREYGTI